MSGKNQFSKPEGVDASELHPNTKLALARIKEDLKRQEKEIEKGDNTATAITRGLANYFKQQNEKNKPKKKKEKAKLKSKTKQQLRSLAKKIPKNLEIKPQKNYKAREALGHDEKFDGKFTDIRRKVFGKLKNETDADRARLEQISHRGLKARMWQGENTLRYLKEGSKVRGRFDIPSNGAFAGTRIHTELSVAEFQRQAKMGKKTKIAFLCPGIGGSAGGRFGSTFRAGENIIGATIEDACALKQRDSGAPYYLWRNMNHLSVSRRKEVFSSYCTNLVVCLEARLGCRIEECSWAGHSGGGEILHMLAECFPDFRIPLKCKNPDGSDRYLRIAAIDAADSAYKGNGDLCYSFVGKKMKKEVMQALNDPKSKLKEDVIAYQKNPSEALKEKITRKIEAYAEKATAQSIKTFVLSVLYRPSKPERKKFKTEKDYQVALRRYPKLMAKYKKNVTDVKIQFDSAPPREIIDNFTSKSTDQAVDKIVGRHCLLFARNSRSIRTSDIPYQMIKGMKAITPKLVDYLVRGEINQLKFPKYFAAVEDYGWRHQYRANLFGLSQSGKNGILAHKIVDRYPNGSFPPGMSDKKKSKKRHWYAWGKYSREFLDFANS